jgi:hypothetical protein
MEGEELYCETCGTVAPFEQPPCPDEHDNCPEWVCTRCGEVILLATVPVVVPQQKRRAA